MPLSELGQLLVSSHMQATPAAPLLPKPCHLKTGFYQIKKAKTECQFKCKFKCKFFFSRAFPKERYTEVMDSITIHAWFLFDHKDAVSKKHRSDPKPN